MIKKESGQILILVFVALGVVLFTVLFIVAGAQLYFQNSSYSLDAEAATALAEAGIDKALSSLNQTGGSFNPSPDSEIPLGDGTFTLKISSPDASTKVIEATGYIPNKDRVRVRRTIKISSSRGIGVAFNYGIQVGEGGMELGNENTVKGSIYSNGSITAGNNNVITGDAWVAAGVAPTADQQTDCDGSNCQDFLFGKNISGQNILDVAQSFKPSVTDKIRKVSLKVKKIGPGSHQNLTVRIMSDDNGSPKKNDVLASGILSSVLVTDNYGFIDVTFSTNPTLDAGINYWIMIDSTSDNNNYWSWQKDLAQSYNNGRPKWSPDWSVGNPTWNSFAEDLSFKLYLGGTINSLVSGSNTVIQGDAHANTINGLTIQRDAYYQSITNSTVGGTSFPGSEDPPPQAFPISQANIDSWKEEAGDAGPLLQPICDSQIPWGPGKYNGNLTLENACSIKVKTPVWITGNIIMGNSNTFTLDSSYGNNSGVIILGEDGTNGMVTMGNTNRLLGTGEGNSVLMLLSTYDSTTNNNNAITIGNVGNTGVFYADKGIVDPGNSNQFKELTAWKIKLTNGSVIDYETGLASLLFSSGPSGSYSLIKGTYQVK